jgi:hypothetical protein
MLGGQGMQHDPLLQMGLEQGKPGQGNRTLGVVERGEGTGWVHR